MARGRARVEFADRGRDIRQAELHATHNCAMDNRSHEDHLHRTTRPKRTCARHCPNLDQETNMHMGNAQLERICLVLKQSATHCQISLPRLGTLFCTRTTSEMWETKFQAALGTNVCPRCLAVGCGTDSDNLEGEQRQRSHAERLRPWGRGPVKDARQLLAFVAIV